MTTTAYITTEQFQSLCRPAELTALTKDGTDPATTLAAVNSEVHSYVASVRPDGLAEVPMALTMAAFNLARFYLYSVNPPPHVVDAWKAAVAYLQSVAAGKVALPAIVDNPDTTEDEGGLEAGVWFVATESRLKGW